MFRRVVFVVSIARRRVSQHLGSDDLQFVIDNVLGHLGGKSYGFLSSRGPSRTPVRAGGVGKLVQRRGDPSGFGGATLFAPASKPSTYAEPIPMHAVHPMASGPEPLQSNLDFIQFNGPVPSSTRHASNRHTPTIPASANLANEETFRFNGAAAERKTGDGYFPNRDLAGIEGLTYLDEEQKLWNEITNDAGWLQPSGVPSVRPESQYNFGPGARGSNLPSHNSINNFVGAYTDIVNLEFHEDT